MRLPPFGGSLISFSFTICKRPGLFLLQPETLFNGFNLLHCLFTESLILRSVGERILNLNVEFYLRLGS